MAHVETVISFRHLLAGAVEAFLQDQGLSAPATAAVLAELVVVLSRYREEGTALYPRVFVCADLDALMQHVGARDALTLGDGPEAPETARLALKTCAPLAQGGWSTFLERRGAALRFGVFRTDDFVLDETPLERLRHTDDAGLRAVGIVQVAENVIELCGSAGPSRYVYLSGARSDSTPFGVVSHELLTSLTRDVPASLRADLYTFYRRVLLDVVRAPHGSLVAVTEPGQDTAALFHDGVFLPEPLAVGAAIAAYRAAPDASARASLEALRVLLRGMTASDGITLLRSDGAIVGFNVFVTHRPAIDVRHGAVPGGARRRTFETLVALLGHGLVAAFCRSQDGHAECRRAGD